MAQYINKAALVAEIEKRFDEYASSILKHYDACKEAKAQELSKILIIINTLEVKDVDLELMRREKEMRINYANEEKSRSLCCSGCNDYNCYTKADSCVQLKNLMRMADWKDEQLIEQLTAFAQHLNKRGAFRDDLCMDFEHEAQSFIEMQKHKEL